MTIFPPDKKQLTALIGEPLYEVWTTLSAMIEQRYDMERLWSSGGKKWTFEYKYRRGGKTLCCLYAKERCVGLMVIFGSAEREAFEAERAKYPACVRDAYDEAATYHDGKWVMFLLSDSSPLQDLVDLLHIKRRPNRRTE